MRPSRSNRSQVSWSRSGKPLLLRWMRGAPCWRCLLLSTRNATRLERTLATSSLMKTNTNERSTERSVYVLRFFKITSGAREKRNGFHMLLKVSDNQT